MMERIKTVRFHPMTKVHGLSRSHVRKMMWLCFWFAGTLFCLLPESLYSPRTIALNTWFHISLCMSNITLYLPDKVKEEVDSYQDIRWSEVVRQAILNKLLELRKLVILRKYVEKQPFSDDDLKWMDENDWHPVDEKEMKLGFVKSVAKASKEKTIKVKSVSELFE